MPFEVEADVASAIHTFKFNEFGLRELMQGPVEADLIRRAIRVEAAAKNNATGENGGPHVRTGRLRASITWRLGRDEISPYVDIGSNVHYAVYVELGTSRAPAYPFLVPALEAARY